jgi:LEM3-like protein
MRYEVPRSHYVYEFSYPDGMPEGLAGIVFYVGLGTNLSRMDNRFIEASHRCPCDKCNAIRSVWDAGLVVARRIVFESTDIQEVRHEEASRIAQHQSPYLTNVTGNEVQHKLNKSPHLYFAIFLKTCYTSFTDGCP